MSDTQASNNQPTNPVPELPEELAILPIFGQIIFPMTIIPLAIGQPGSIQLIDDALRAGQPIGIVTLKATDERPVRITPDDFYHIGCVVNVHRLLKMPDGTLRVAVQGLERIQIEEITQHEPYFRARVRVLPDVVEDGLEVEALMRNLQGLVTQMAQLIPQFPEELQTAVINEDDPRRLAYLLALYTRMDLPDRQAILEETSVRRKLERLGEILRRELQVLQIGQQIQGQVNEEVSRSQREYILRQQLEAIRRELGEEDPNAQEIERLREAIAQAGMPDEVREIAERELERLRRMNPAAPDYSITRTYLEILTSLPWNKRTEDQLDIEVARRVLDEDHYDLEEIKERILEFLAVRELRRERLKGEQVEQPSEGAILCFVGPPGVGKTSLGRSIARAMNRKFLRISLGGLRDEAEIRGHRRTYIGAMPGVIIQSLRRVGVNNPVFMLDEIDKLGMDFRGDPASALLEVLDPEQNNAFRDHYLDVPFDLSNVFFIATANALQPIPAPLRDRMEIIQLSGYTLQQKLEIAKRYLVPEQLKRHALSEQDVVITEDALRVVIEEYTREAGVRNLERAIATLCRKVAVEVLRHDRSGTAAGNGQPEAQTNVAAGNGQPEAQTASPARQPIVIDAERARQYLGKQIFFQEVAERTDRPGVVTGLVWTPVGGEIIFIEATKMPGSKGFMLTGQLGDVMKESARAALSIVRAEAEKFGIARNFFDGVDIHLHVPAGAIPKDGPSAGVAMVTALVSLLTGRPVRDDVAMTGEITLRGKVLPVGGIKEKVLAAHRAGIRTVILPRRNERDLEEIPEELRAEMNFVLVDRVEEVLKAALRDEVVEPPVEAAPPVHGAPPIREHVEEGVHIVDSSVEAPDEEPVDAPSLPAPEH
ncbi:endopeptidase La [Kallotenue papyrolyticum]|uniref:endopeptidase La n=1 Tax=Kallotenue papyrolyticum TaxID=1325125 RepID=UPI0004927309|nr:endopeptidase La [Kallotenue papyrolyticum]